MKPRPLHFQVFGRGAPAQFYQRRLAADGVGRAVQQLRSHYAAGQVAVNVYVFGVDHVADAHFAGHGLGAFVYAAGYGNVRVLVDDAGR